MAKGNLVLDSPLESPPGEQAATASRQAPDMKPEAEPERAVTTADPDPDPQSRRSHDPGDDQMVMQSYRITKAQARALELVATLTGQKKAEIVREAINEKITRLASVDSVEQMAAAYRERLLQQTKALKQSLGTD